MTMAKPVFSKAASFSFFKSDPGITCASSNFTSIRFRASDLKRRRCRSLKFNVNQCRKT